MSLREGSHPYGYGFGQRVASNSSENMVQHTSIEEAGFLQIRPRGQ
jgi:hypothetical protein